MRSFKLFLFHMASPQTGTVDKVFNHQFGGFLCESYGNGITACSSSRTLATDDAGK